MKMLNILIAAEFILILAVIALTVVDNNKMPTAYAVKEIKNIGNNSFKLSTKAICEEKSNHVSCNDRLFAECDGKEYIVSEQNLENFTECGKTSLNLSDAKVIGSAVFEKKWIDPRKNG